MSQSKKEGENRPRTPFPPADREDWELQFRNQVQALRISQGDQEGQSQGQEQVPIVSRTESDTELLRPAPLRLFANRRAPSHPDDFPQSKPEYPRNLTEGVWIDDNTRAQIAPNVNSPIHIGPSPLGSSVSDPRGDEDIMETLLSMIASAFREQEEAANHRTLYQQDMSTQTGVQDHGSDNSRTDTGRRELGDQDSGNEENRMDES